MDTGFEWDERKRVENIAKHGVDFRRAAMIFFGPVIENIDRREDYGEERLRALGRVEDEYYLVSYMWRGANRRIISAWRVGDRGRQRYQTILGG